MTRKQDSAKGRMEAEDLKRLLAEHGDLLKAIVEETLQQVLQAEMEEALQAEKRERTDTRLGYRCGYYSRMLVTRVGKIELRVPQHRPVRFRTEVFERYQRSVLVLFAPNEPSAETFVRVMLNVDSELRRRAPAHRK